MTDGRVCIECNGTGYVCYLDDRREGQWPTQKCPACGGSGREPEGEDGLTAESAQERGSGA